MLWPVVGAAALGALVSAVMGWLDSGQSFNPRKFAYSAVHAVIAAAVFTTSLPDDTPKLLVVAFLGGAGIDVLGNRLKGAFTVALRPPQPARPAQPPRPPSP